MTSKQFDILVENVSRQVINEMFEEELDERKKKKHHKKKKDEDNKDSDYLPRRKDSIKMSNKLKDIIEPVEQSYNKDVASYNLTRSQLAYQLWPDLDPDTARSKFSQKMEGKKKWKGWEINRLYNIIAGRLG